jgi:hypothetical protein
VGLVVVKWCAMTIGKNLMEPLVNAEQQHGLAESLSMEGSGGGDYGSGGRME